MDFWTDNGCTGRTKTYSFNWRTYTKNIRRSSKIDFKEFKYDILTILGCTATGKTSIAVNTALKINAEIISADSRQVYRGMDIGTGKDLEEYKGLKYHLIDIKDAGYRYNVFEYQKDFLKVYTEITEQNKIPLLCGGTGMYINAATQNYNLIKVPVNNKLRESLREKSLKELERILASYKKLHNKSDTDTVKRAIRAIEIADYYQNNPDKISENKKLNSLFIGIKVDREERRKRISERLKRRLDEGMIEEVELLMKTGLKAEQLTYYGLEYKFITKYILGEFSYDEFYKRLETAIHQFAKRQMTWFRSMEKKGIKINWIDGMLNKDEISDKIIKLAEL